MPAPKNYLSMSLDEVMALPDVAQPAADIPDSEVPNLMEMSVADMDRMLTEQPDMLKRVAQKDYDNSNNSTLTGLGVGLADAVIGIGQGIGNAPDMINRLGNAGDRWMGIKPEPEGGLLDLRPLGDAIVEGGKITADTLGEFQQWLRKGDGGIAQAFRRADEDARRTNAATKDTNIGEAASAVFTPAMDKISEGDYTGAFKALGDGDFSKAGDLLASGDWKKLGSTINPGTIGSAIGQAAPSLAAAIYGGIPAIAFLEATGAATNARDFEKRTGVKVTNEQFAQAVYQTTLVNTMLEKFGLDRLMKSSKGIKAALGGVLAEGGTEGLQTVNQGLAEWKAYNPDKEVTDDLVMSIIGGMGAGAGVAAGSLAFKPKTVEEEDSGAQSSTPVEEAADQGDVAAPSSPAEEAAPASTTPDARASLALDIVRGVPQESGGAPTQQRTVADAINDPSLPAVDVPTFGDGTMPPGDYGDIVINPKAEEVNQEAAKTAEPTEAQKEAGNYRKGHIKVHGLDISIETPQGRERTGVDSDGNPWANESPAHYGYLKKTTGADGEHVDTYVGPNPQSEKVFIVNQVNPEDGSFDETKVLMGFSTYGEAVETYINGFSDGSGADRIGGEPVQMSVDEFKDWLKNGDTTKPVTKKTEKVAPAATAATQESLPLESLPQQVTELSQLPEVSTLTPETAETAMAEAEKRHDLTKDPAAQQELKAYMDAAADIAIKKIPAQEALPRSLKGPAEVADTTVVPEEYRSIAETYQRIQSAVRTKDADSLRGILDKLQNKKSRKAFTEATGVALPNTVGGTQKAIDEWAGVTEQERESRTQKREQAAKLTQAAKNVDRIGKRLEGIPVGESNVKAWADAKIEEGYSKVTKEGRDYVLVNDKGEGYNLTKLRGPQGISADIRDYVSSKAAIKTSKQAPEARSSQVSGEMPPPRRRNTISPAQGALPLTKRAGDEQYSVRDATARTETPEFKNWFKGSKVTDAEGKPLTVYHGTGSEIEAFSPKFMNQGNDQHGSGFYFTTEPSEASGYANSTLINNGRKPGAFKGNPNVLPVHLNIKNPLPANATGTITEKQVRKIIERSPVLEEALSNWGDVGYSGKESVIREALPNYAVQDENIVSALNNIANDFFPGENVAEFNKAVRDVLGFDGVRVDSADRTHWVAWFPEQVKSTLNQGSFNPADDRISYSVSESATGPAEPFFYATEQAVSNMKMKKADGKQWLASIQNTPGVKAEEIEWLGLREWLEEQKGSVSKEEVQDFIDGNKLEIEEVELSEKSSDTTEEQKEVDQALRKVDLLKAKVQEKRDKIEDFLIDSGGIESRTARNIIHEMSRGSGLYRHTREALEEKLESVKQGLAQEFYELEADFGEAQNNHWIAGDELFRARARLDAAQGKSGTKYGTYTLPGGENYREILFTLPMEKSATYKKLQDERAPLAQRKLGEELPDGKTVQQRLDEIDAEMEKQKQNTYRSNHFDQSNILAHTRVKDRVTTDGKRVLGIEEIQSDWHQEGRRKGYNEKPYYKVMSTAGVHVLKQGGGGPAIFESEQEARDYAARNENWVVKEVSGPGVPDAPFKKNWHEFVFKKMLREAVEGGYDGITWTTGEQQADRFNLSQHIDELIVEKNDDGTFNLSATLPNGGRETKVADGVAQNKLADYVGKELAEKISQQEYRSDIYDAQDLKIGGEGMKGFYDNILPSFANKYTKKWGGQVTRAEFITSGYGSPSINRTFAETHFLEITPAMRESVMRGQPLFAQAKFSEKFLESEEAIKRRIFEIARQMNPNVKVKVVNELFGEGPALLASGAKTTERQPVSGAYSPAMQLVRVSMAGGDPIGAAYHELWHSLESMLTETEQALLQKHFPGNENVSHAEQVAYAYQDWATLREKAKQPETIKRIFQKLMQLFQKLGNYLRSLGFNTVESVFETALVGDIAARMPEKPILQMDTEVADYYDSADPFAFGPDADNARGMTDAIAERNARLMETEEQKDQAVQYALDSLKKSIRDFRNAPPLEPKVDMGFWGNYLIHPRTIAKVYDDFTPVWNGAEKMFQIRDRLSAELGLMLEPYYQLEDKSRVNAVLEIGRLQGEVYGGNAIAAKNVAEGDASLSKPGQTVKLNKRESEAYIAVRAAMDMAMENMKNLLVYETGIDPFGPNAPKNSQDVIKMQAQMGFIGPDRKDDLTALAANLDAIEEAKRKGYVPFTRFGDYAMVVKKDGSVVHREHFEVDGWLGMGTTLKRGVVDNRRKELQRQYPAAQGFSVSEPFRLDSEQAVKKADLDLSSLDALVYAGGLNGAYYDNFREVIAQQLKKRGFKRHFFKSLNIPGYSVDFERSLSEYVYSLSSYVANRSMKPVLDKAIAGINPVKKRRLRQYAEDYVGYIQTPQEEWQKIRNLAFTFYLAGNFSSALVNHTQVYALTAPYLTQYTDAADVTAELAAAYKDAAKMVRFKESGKPYFDMDKAPKDVAADMRAANDRGDLVPQMTFEQMGIAHGRSKLLRKQRKKLKAVVDVLGDVYGSTERLNRIITYIATHRIAQKKGVREKVYQVHKNDPLWQSDANDVPQRYDVKDIRNARNDWKPVFNTALPPSFPDKLAHWVIDETHFKMGKINRPRLFRKAGAALLQFKSFSAMALEQEILLARGMISGSNNKETRTANARAIAVHAGMLIMFAGLFGLPFADDLKRIMEMMHKGFTDIDLDIEKEIRTTVADIFEELGLGEYGAATAEFLTRGPARGLGIDIAQRAGMGNILPMDTVGQVFFGQDATRTGSDVLGIPFDMTFGRLQRVAEKVKLDRPWYDIASELLPNFAKNPIQAYSWAQEGVQSKGRTVIEPAELDKMDVFLKAAGFTSSEVAVRRELEWMARRAQTAITDLQTKYYTRLAKAYAKGDIEAAQQVRDEIREYNKDAPVHEKVILTPYYLERLVEQEKGGYDSRRSSKKSRGETQRIRDLNRYKEESSLPKPIPLATIKKEMPEIAALFEQAAPPRGKALKLYSEILAG